MKLMFPKFPNEPEGKKQFWLSTLRFIPFTVALYTGAHTWDIVAHRYPSGWMFWLLIMGAISIEILMTVTFELLHQNLVHASQRVTALITLFACTIFSTLVILGELGALKTLNTFSDIILLQILPLAPIIAQWFVIGIFLTDHESKMATLHIREVLLDSIVRHNAKRKIMRELQREIRHVESDPEKRSKLATETMSKIEAGIYSQFAENFNLPERLQRKPIRQQQGPTLTVAVGGDGKL